MMSTQPAIFSHEPVMVREITELFANVPDGVVLDATLGGAGHCTSILDAHPGLRVLGLDRDPARLVSEATAMGMVPGNGTDFVSVDPVTVAQVLVATGGVDPELLSVSHDPLVNYGAVKSTIGDRP